MLKPEPESEPEPEPGIPGLLFDRINRIYRIFLATKALTAACPPSCPPSLGEEGSSKSDGGRKA
jgi:hypothetical protein